MNRVAPLPPDNIGALLLEGTGESPYRQFDVITQWHMRADREILFSYTRSFAAGDLNDFGRFLGGIPTPLIRENYNRRLPTDLPNRFLTWGVVRLPRWFQIAPVGEYRSGFPYLETNASRATRNPVLQPVSDVFLNRFAIVEGFLG